MSGLRVEGLSYAYGRPAAAAALAAAVENVSFELEPGRFLCLLGPSGCGKTTLLRLVGGYLTPGAGRLWLGGEELTALPPERRGIGMVFQSYALFPHLSARDNVAFPLRARRVPRAERERRVERILDRVQLSAAERGRRPAQLSGGQQQRVALARALVFAPRLLLLDEPFANLDRALREQLRGELRELQRESGVAAILVTHDQDEALALADELMLMWGGRVLQHAAPDALYRRPHSALAARLLGDANLLEVRALEGAQLRLQGGIRVARDPAAAGPVPGSLVLVRPEDWRIARGPGEPCACEGRVAWHEYLGAERLLGVQIAPDTLLRVRARPDEAADLAPGTALRLQLAPAHAWVIPEPAPAVQGALDAR